MERKGGIGRAKERYRRGMCEVANQALIESSPAHAVLVNGAGSESAQLLPNMVTSVSHSQ